MHKPGIQRHFDSSIFATCSEADFDNSMGLLLQILFFTSSQYYLFYLEERGMNENSSFDWAPLVLPSRKTEIFLGFNVDDLDLLFFFDHF